MVQGANAVALGFESAVLTDKVIPHAISTIHEIAFGTPLRTEGRVDLLMAKTFRQRLKLCPVLQGAAHPGRKPAVPLLRLVEGERVPEVIGDHGSAGLHRGHFVERRVHDHVNRGPALALAPVPLHVPKIAALDPPRLCRIVLRGLFRDGSQLVPGEAHLVALVRGLGDRGAEPLRSTTMTTAPVTTVISPQRGDDDSYIVTWDTMV